MSPLASRYAPCLWYWLWETKSPASWRRDAHSRSCSASSPSSSHCAATCRWSASAVAATRSPCVASMRYRSTRRCTVASRTSSWRIRPTRSNSSPSRSAISETSMCSMSNASRTADSTATPPGSTGRRSSLSSLSLTASTCRALISSRLMRRSAARSIPFSHHPAARAMAAIDRIVPEEPTVESQPASRYCRSIGSNSTAAASTARFIEFLSIRPPGKNLRLMLTQPMYRLSRYSGVKPFPMMHSVLPPPMSMTRRRSPSSASACATPR